MITNTSHTKDWIESFRKIPGYNNTDPAFYYWYKCLEEIGQLKNNKSL